MAKVPVSNFTILSFHWGAKDGSVFSSGLRNFLVEFRYQYKVRKLGCLFGRTETDSSQHQRREIQQSCDFNL